MGGIWMKRYNKIIRYYICSILTTLIFLIGSTYCWFNFKKFDVTYLSYNKMNVLVSDDIEFSNLQKVSDEDISKVKNYSFFISNNGSEEESIKIMITPDLLKKNVNNNYLKYSINGSDVRSLNMDGVIYIDKLDSYETKNIDLKVWISDTYQGELNYNGRCIVS